MSQAKILAGPLLGAVEGSLALPGRGLPKSPYSTWLCRAMTSGSRPQPVGVNTPHLCLLFFSSLPAHGLAISPQEDLMGAGASTLLPLPLLRAQLLLA